MPTDSPNWRIMPLCTPLTKGIKMHYDLLVIGLLLLVAVPAILRDTK